MELTCRAVEGVHVVTLSGSLISAEAARARQQLNEIISMHSPYLIIDLARLNFIDARGLSVFISALKTAHKYGGEVLLLNPTPVVRALIELTRLQQTFSIFADEMAAIAHCTHSLSQVT
jgi:anti-sigma B factor antagonist